MPRRPAPLLLQQADQQAPQVIGVGIHVAHPTRLIDNHQPRDAVDTPGLGDRMITFLRGEAPSEEPITVPPVEFVNIRAR